MNKLSHFQVIQLTTMHEVIDGNLEELYALRDLRELDISFCNSFPPGFKSLQSLQTVRIQNSRGIDSVVSELGELPFLTDIEITNCNITTLPPTIGNLTHLKHLNLSCNTIAHLPVSFGFLTALERLNLNNNQLVTLPNSFSHLNNLFELQLNNNQLSALPPEFDHLTKLERLFLSENQFESIPQTIGNMLELNFVDISCQQPPLNPVSYPIQRAGHGKYPVLPKNANGLGYETDPRFSRQFSLLRESLQRFNEFVTSITEKIRNNDPLTEWDLNFPLYLKYKDILEKMCYENPTETAKHVLTILAQKEKIQLKGSKKRQILL